MSNLILHCGAETLDRAGLQTLPAPERNGPLHHADYVDHVTESLTQHGLVVTDENFGVQRGGAQFFGLMTVEGDGIIANDEFAFTIGLRASYDMSLPLGFAAGSRVFVCDNLAFYGETTISTKQTSRLFERAPVLIDETVRILADKSREQLAHFDAYKGANLTGNESDAALTRLVREGVFAPSEMGRVIAEYDEPSHPEFAEDSNVWRLFNAATEVLKPRRIETPRLPNLAPRTVKLHRVCDELAGLPLAA